MKWEVGTTGTARKRALREKFSDLFPPSASPRLCASPLFSHSALAVEGKSSQNRRMQHELQQAIETGKISNSAAEKLERLSVGAFCRHKSWGFGRIAEWSLLTGKLLIDFPGRKSHPMQVEYAVESLEPIPSTHVLARRITEPEAVRAEAAADPVGLVRTILSDLGGKATAGEISDALVPEVFDAAGFKKWWESTKRKLKADGQFLLPTKKSAPIEWLDEPIVPGQGLIKQFQNARFLKEQVAAMDGILKNLDDLAQETSELGALVTQIDEAARKGLRAQAAQALELLLARDEILAHYETLTLAPGAVSAADFLAAEDRRLPELFAKLPAAKQRRALELFPEAFGEEWIQRALDLAKRAPARLVVEIARLCERQGRSEDLQAALGRWIADRSVTGEILIWLAKERGGAFPELFTAGLLTAILSSLEQDLLSEKRGSRLHDLLLDDRTLLTDLLEDAPPEVVRDAVRRLQLTPVFDDLNKRSLLGRILKRHPELQSMVGGGEEEEEVVAALIVSWASLEARKAAYERLVNVEIPQNIRDISTAREQGDLRENFGFKAAKEQQRVLMRRRAEMERDLAHARGTDFESPDTSQVSIGTVVTLGLPGGSAETYAILGAWDSIPEKGVVSYLAGIGQALLGKKPNETAQLPSDSGPRSVTIQKIEAFTDLAILRPGS